LSEEEVKRSLQAQFGSKLGHFKLKNELEKVEEVSERDPDEIKHSISGLPPSRHGVAD
jgi:hypothetical protein